MRSFVRMNLAALLAWGMVCLPLSAAPAAMVTPLAGIVSLNGQSVVNGSAVLPGDAIRVSAQGGARLTLPGTAVLAGANSRFKLAANAIRLNYGTLKVSGREAVQSGMETIAPAAVSGVFTVTRLSSVLYVSANRGAVRVTAGSKSYNIAAGKAMRFQTAPAAAGSGSSGLPVAAVVGIAAAAAVVTGVVVHEATKCSNCVPASVSPSF